MKNCFSNSVAKIANKFGIGVAVLSICDSALSGRAPETSELPNKIAPLCGAILLPFFFLITVPAYGATTVSGPVSGLWTTNDSPYLVIADLEIPWNRSLEIKPGVEVVVAPGIKIRARGNIIAEGKYDQPIHWKGTSTTNRWECLQVYYNANISRFEHCIFTDANFGLLLTIIDINATMATEIVNCTFENIANTCISGRAAGYPRSTPTGIYARDPVLNPVIRNCIFKNSGAGCRLETEGHYVVTGNGGRHYGRGYANPYISNNLFKNLTREAFEGIPNGGAGSSTPIFINNTVKNCGVGILGKDPFDIGITNNIFTDCTVAISRTGNLNENIRHNAFYANGTDFDGYPATFGDPLIVNANGDPVDLAFNLIADPRFADTKSLTLAANSPCIDAGSPDIEDMCLPPSQGTIVSDMGAFGGVHACDWPRLDCSTPEVGIHPRSIVGCIGQPATLTAGFAGSKPLAYQWYNQDGHLVQGATNSSLTFPSVQLEDAGSYYVEASNECGSIVSKTASINVTDICLSIDLYPGLTMDNLVAGQTYLIQATSMLGDTNAWETVYEMQATSSEMFWMDPQSTRLGKRYYRVGRQ